MAQTLLALAELITNTAHEIDAVCQAEHATFPSLDSPFSTESETIRSNPQVVKATEVLAAAAEQILAAAWNPARFIFDACFGFHVSSAVRVAAAVNVTEVLREAGPKGAHVDEIVAGTVVSPQKLARILRLLASRHIFREVSPDVFANNRLSSLLDTGKSVAELRANPAQKFDNTNGLVAFMECTIDEFMKASSYLTEAVTRPETAQSDKPSETAICLALNIKKGGDHWTWLEEPENAMNLRRFGIAMQGARMMAPEEQTLQGFGWRDLPAESTIIDVGGGTGHVAMVLTKAFPHVKLVVQDRPQAIEHGKEFWATTMPEAVDSGRVLLEAHDFFKPQPARDPPAVYLLRFIIHDWADSIATQILRLLREAAAPSTKLILIERIIPYACKVARKGSTAIPGSEDGAVNVPTPLLPNLGVVNLNGYLCDIQMMAGLNGQERTLQQFEKLFASAGWKLDRVYRTDGMASQLVGTPV